MILNLNSDCRDSYVRTEPVLYAVDIGIYSTTSLEIFDYCCKTRQISMLRITPYCTAVLKAVGFSRHLWGESHTITAGDRTIQMNPSQANMMRHKRINGRKMIAGDRAQVLRV
jgi:hypothetical protein